MNAYSILVNYFAPILICIWWMSHFRILSQRFRITAGNPLRYK
jgi:hypothetical protein